MTMAPHNFGSKIGIYAQTHLGRVTPNWEVSEVDDSQFPAIGAHGIEIRNGAAIITGRAGLGVSLKEELLEKPSLELKASSAPQPSHRSEGNLVRHSQGSGAPA